MTPRSRRRRRTLATRLLLLPAVVALIGAAAPKPWAAPAEWKKKSPPFEPTETQLRAGEAVYKQLCVSCHGATGKGDGPIAKMLKVPPGDLTRPRADTVGELYWKVTTGRFPMPSYEDRLKDAERWQLALYLRRLAPRPAADSGP